MSRNIEGIWKEYGANTNKLLTKNEQRKVEFKFMCSAGYFLSNLLGNLIL